VRRILVALGVLAGVLAGVAGALLTTPARAGAETTADQVVVGVYINDIQDINLASNSFNVDFYLWLRWKNPDIDPSLTIEPMNSNAEQNSTSSSTGGVAAKLLYDAPLDMPDGSKYMALRYQGVFSKEYNLETYPFDVQNLLLIFEDQRAATDKIEYVPDTTPVTIKDDVTIPGYEVGRPALSVIPYQYPTNFGDISIPPDVKYSRIIVTIPMERDVLPYLVKIMLPIFIVVLITSLIYIIPARLEEARAGIGVTAMLTIVALQWTTDSSLPSVEYLTMLDLIYILAMLYILIAMGYTVMASRRNRHEVAEALATSLDRRVGVASLFLYVGLTGLTMLFYVQNFR